MKTFGFSVAKSDLQLARLYSITPRNGEPAVNLTDADHDVTIGLATYVSVPASNFSDISYASQARANALEISGSLIAGGPFDPLAVALQKFASAVVVVRGCDLSDLSTSSWLFGGLIGDQTYSEDQTSIKFEVRSNLALAKTILVETYGSLCRANFGDYVNPSNPGRCKLPVKPDDILRDTVYAVGDFVRVKSGGADDPSDYANRYYVCTIGGQTDSIQPSYTTTIDALNTDGTAVFKAQDAYLRTVEVLTIADDGMSFTIADPADARVVDDWFKLGWFAINGNYGLALEVRASVAATFTIKTWLPITGVLDVGDLIDLSPGCDKRRVVTCAGRFSNAINNRSES